MLIAGTTPSGIRNSLQRDNSLIPCKETNVSRVRDVGDVHYRKATQGAQAEGHLRGIAVIQVENVAFVEVSVENLKGGN